MLRCGVFEFNSCFPTFKGETKQTCAKLNDQTRAYEHTGKIRGQPTWISNHLQNSHVGIELGKSGLVKGFA